MPNWLPVGVAAFIGREHERAKVADLVADRVVTLTGSGGCGKTRLALEVAGAVASRFRDGACWVDLQGVSERGLVAPAIGGAVGVHERPDEALVDTLAGQLRARHLLVVLDDCEHLVGACAELVGRLSSACPQLHVLATKFDRIARADRRSRARVVVLTLALAPPRRVVLGRRLGDTRDHLGTRTFVDHLNDDHERHDLDVDVVARHRLCRGRDHRPLHRVLGGALRCEQRHAQPR